MEELQSTEALDREILEDARKKAHRILKTADDTIKTKSTEWEKTITVALGELEKKYAVQGKIAADEIMAFLPIDKQRIRTTKVEELLRSAVENWYNGLSRQRVLDLLHKELTSRLGFSETVTGHKSVTVEGTIRALIHKIEQAEAQSVLKAVLPGKTCQIETIKSTAVYPEIILETPEMRIYASIGKTVEFFLGEKRAELVEALLGKSVTSGEES
jgi:nitroimidazol reductase NimA-like FMN-containing flavoprotein (pyridoxamine 5'-phosphate oxidase superfamily)